MFRRFDSTDAIDLSRKDVNTSAYSRSSTKPLGYITYTAVVTNKKG